MDSCIDEPCCYTCKYYEMIPMPARGWCHRKPVDPFVDKFECAEWELNEGL